MTFTEAIAREKFYLLGIGCLVVAVYHSVLVGLVMQWYQDANYSHGFIVPLIAGYFLYERKTSLKAAPVVPWNPGVLIFILGLVQLLIGTLATEYFTMRTSLVVTLAGMVLFFFGKAIFQRFLLPLGYLLLMVPLPYIIYNAVAFPLRLLVSKISVSFLKLIGIVVMREGNLIIFPNMILEVAEACSGLRSLMSLLTLGVAYAFILKMENWKRWVIIIATVPIAIFANVVRVIISGVLAQYYGTSSIEGLFHEFAGLLVFSLAVLMLAWLGALLWKNSESA